MAETAPPGGTETLSPHNMPWSPDGNYAANLAIGNLREWAFLALKNERGVHAESLFVLLGALAGHCTAHAAWERVEKENIKLMDVGTRDSRHFFYGDELNAYLVPGPGSTLPAWSFVAGGAITAGVPADALPDFGEIFKHVTETVGTPEYGILRTPPEHQPAFQPRQALLLFWPPAHTILSQPASPALGATESPPPAAGESRFGHATRGMFGKKAPPPPKLEYFAKQHWPIAVAIVAQQYIAMTKDVLDPRWAVKIFMEAAITMSKLHPQEIPQKAR